MKNTWNRREILSSATGVAVLAAASGAEVVAASTDHKHKHHHHNKAPEKVMNELLKCIDKSELCIAHCYTQLATGDGTLAACAQRAEEAISMCRALRTVLLNGATTIPAVAAAAAEVCKACAKECEIHAKEHAECKACGDSCVSCEKECHRLMA